MKPYLQDGFIRNSWYVAAWSHEVTADNLFARTLLGEPLVFHRLADGSIAALRDQCCHRAAPLSLGRKEGDCVRCGYHGMKFDAGGKCVEIPGQDTIPAHACVRRGSHGDATPAHDSSPAPGESRRFPAIRAWPHACSDAPPGRIEAS